MSKVKLYVAGGSNGYAGWLVAMGWELVYNERDCDVIMFTGGGDLAYDLYEANQGSHTGNPNRHREDFENRIFEEGVRNGKKFIGTCLGWQRLAVMSFLGRSRLVQHVQHPSTHIIHTPFDEFGDIQVCSLHHQIPLLDEKITGLVEGKDWNLLGWCRLSPFLLDGNDQNYDLGPDHREAEIGYIPSTQSLGIQSHFEIHSLNSVAVQYGQFLAKRYLLGESVEPPTEDEIIGIGQRRLPYDRKEESGFYWNAFD